MARFLLEILTEEVPYTLQKQAEEDIKLLFIEAFKNREVTYENLIINSTPRRLVILAEGLPEKIDDKSEEKKGPRSDSTDSVVQSFLKTYGLSLQDCQLKKTDKGEFYFYKQTKAGGLVSDLLAEMVIKHVLEKMRFKKSMRWDSSNTFWSRPIRSLLAMFNHNIMEISFAGLTSSNKTCGHRFLGEKVIEITSIDDYFSKLKSNFVILSSAERKEKIINQIDSFAEIFSLQVYNNNSLLEELVYLVEYPEPLLAEIPDKYMFLPKELLLEIIIKNQRYINFINHDGTLSSKFVIVANLKPMDGGKNIIAGNLKVLQARLEDGKFFYFNDLKCSTVNRVEKLKSINFFEGLGSIYDKAIRMQKLFKDLFSEEQNSLCLLAKADLASEVVFEIPELQGIMGYYYAKNDDIEEDMAIAIKDHYKPQGAEDILPTTLLGAKLSLIDKLDTLISFFSIGKKPTGSKDPFALRRAAIGVIRLSENFAIDIDINKYISYELADFFKERLNVYLSTRYNKGLVRTIINEHTDTVFNIFSLINRIKVFDAILKDHSGQSLLALYKRLTNVLKLDNLTYVGHVDSLLLENNIEKDLHDVYMEVASKTAEYIKNNNFSSAIAEILRLSPKVDNFLDNIKINQSASDALRQNRLMLLTDVIKLCNLVFNFDNIE